MSPMRFWVGVTDNSWFSFFAQRNFDEVNFWQPSGKPPFATARVPVGMPFLFKLKRPFHHIAGGGFYVGHSVMPLSLAWDVFGEKNGAGSLNELRSLIAPHQRGNQEPEIGCTIITTPTFLPEALHLESPPGFAGNIVVGKFYDSQESDGSTIWQNIGPKLFYATAELPSSSLTLAPVSAPFASHAAEASAKYGAATIAQPRLGQAAFRVLVMDAYARRCAITGENTLIALEAAHIVPYSGTGTHDVRNGLLLRADFHRLFDKGLVTVTPDLTVKVSPRIREAYFNGKAYYRLDNAPLAVIPANANFTPDRDRLKWHVDNVFQAA